MTDSSLDFDTRAIQAGLRGKVEVRSTAPAIYPSTTFTYDDAARTHAALEPMNRGFAYARNANPTVRMLEEAVASLEGTEDAVAFGSGMAAFHVALLSTGVRPGQTVLAAQDLYGISRTLLAGLFTDLGFNIEMVDALDLAAVDEAFGRTQARVLCFEPVSNPLLRVPDSPALIELAHRHGAMAVVDNTFASPFLFRPATFAADIVVESATKYLGGHGDVMAGVVACDEDLARVARTIRTATGGILGPFEAWLVLRGIRTVALRVRRHCENALTLAEWLQGRTEVLMVHYPGLTSHPQHDRVCKRFTDGLAGGMVAFDTPFGCAKVEAFMDALRLAVPGTSLGDVETLVLYPAQSSHRTLTREERESSGIGEGLIRVSVGLESATDIIRDFEQAFAAVGARVDR
jgi:cystathionine beta-lyase/cystathionine gamma-synthase